MGGSPCCGKTSAAEAIALEYGLRLYSCDDHLYEYTLRGAARGSALMRRYLNKDADYTWLREVSVLLRDEFQFYREAGAFLAADLAALPEGAPVLAEGAALTPEFARRRRLAPQKCFYMAPTREFQVEHYRRREWVWAYLGASTRPEDAFANWMERDARFAIRILREAEESGLRSLTVDGSLGIAETCGILREAFGLSGGKIR